MPTIQWNPKGDTEVKCRYCGYEWSYSGMTPYAQCPNPDCMKSNKLEVQ